MVEHDFTSELVEEFYNSCHNKSDGRFCGKKAKGKNVIRIPMSDAARKSNAILRGLAAARRTKDYKNTRKILKSDWADREVGQGGLRGVKGKNSRKADKARAANARKGAITRTKGNPNKDGSQPLKGAFKITGNKTKDALKITQLDRGSAERKKAAAAFQKAYG